MATHWENVHGKGKSDIDHIPSGKTANEHHKYDPDKDEHVKNWKEGDKKIPGYIYLDDEEYKLDGDPKEE